MTASPPPSFLHVTADLEVQVDGVAAHVVGEGGDLVVSTPHPVRLAVAAARGVSPTGVGVRAALTRAAELLATQHLSVTLTGPRGRLVRFGSAVDSRSGRALTGSRHIEVLATTSRLVWSTGVVAAAAAVIVRRRRAGARASRRRR